MRAAHAGLALLFLLLARAGATTSGLEPHPSLGLTGERLLPVFVDWDAAEVTVDGERLALREERNFYDAERMPPRRRLPRPSIALLRGAGATTRARLVLFEAARTAHGVIAGPRGRVWLVDTDPASGRVFATDAGPCVTRRGVAPASKEAGSEAESGATRTLEIVVVSDSTVRDRFGTEAHDYVMGVLFASAGYYESAVADTEVEVVVRDHYVCRDPGELAVNAEGGAVEFLQDGIALGVTRWRPLRPDAVLSLTNDRFAGSTIGVAYVASACSYTHAGGTATLGVGSLALHAVLVAHELGHVLGATHEPTGVMASSVSSSAGSYNTTFGNAAVDAISQFAASSSAACLYTDSGIAMTEPVCGNNQTEVGEECDEGPEGNQLCTTNCTFVGNASCSSGECCLDSGAYSTEGCCTGFRSSCEDPKADNSGGGSDAPYQTSYGGYVFIATVVGVAALAAFGAYLASRSAAAGG